MKAPFRDRLPRPPFRVWLPRPPFRVWLPRPPFRVWLPWRHPRSIPLLAIWSLLLLLLAAACTPTPNSTIQATSASQPTSELSTQPSPTASPQVEIVATATPIPSSTIQAPLPAGSTATPASQPTPTPCPPDLCSFGEALILQRPIAEPDNDIVDATYRFGSTQGGRRDPHHGVEFLNAFGTPVLAAADGVVVVAGEDREPTSAEGVWPPEFYGPYSYFYGNLVVIEHRAPQNLTDAAPNLPTPIYTLYAHLSEISVEQGQLVKAGDEVGKVGLTGVAEGSHLHFEVRLGENTYPNSRNPELWLKPHPDDSGQDNGGLAIEVLDPSGNNVQVFDVVLEHLPEGPEAPNDLEIYLTSYEEKTLIGQLPWAESFGVSDIPPGLYRVTFTHLGLQQALVEVFPGQLTVLTYRVESW